MECILTRRSIRKYTQEPVPQEMIRKLLEAAMAAPSAGNQQAWHFIVMNDRRVLNEVPKFHPHSKMIEEASVAIAVCADPSIETNPGYWPLDCSAATQNILLAANALGLGAVWLGIYPRPERVEGLRKLLKLPQNIIPVSLIPVGFPNENKPPAERFQESRVHYNEW